MASDYSGLLKHLNCEELQQILDDDEKLLNMVNDLHQVKILESEREILIASNKSLAEYNLSLRPVLEQDRHTLLSQYEAAATSKENVIRLKSCLEKTNNFSNSDVALALLQTATAQAEESTETLVEKLLEGEKMVDEFLETYLKERTNVHILRTKCDKMAALLDKNFNPHSTDERPRVKRVAPPPPPSVKVQSSNQLPYPIFPGYGMPQAFQPPNNGSLAPSRMAPLPPVVIPRRNSNSPKVEAKNTSNVFARGPQRSSLPLHPKLPYPQSVQLPN